jgi:hypothetical protein
MRERVRVLGGDLEAGPTVGRDGGQHPGGPGTRTGTGAGFTVRARLPLDG